VSLGTYNLIENKAKSCSWLSACEFKEHDGFYGFKTACIILTFSDLDGLKAVFLTQGVNSIKLWVCFNESTLIFYEDSWKLILQKIFMSLYLWLMKTSSIKILHESRPALSHSLKIFATNVATGESLSPHLLKIDQMDIST